MCTVSITILPDRAIRLACNRDELLNRPPALPPRISEFGERLAAFPIDPISKGTWIAVNDAGLVLSLLNVNAPRRPRAAAPRSRGEIIPSLLQVHDAAEAIALAATSLHAPDYQPFRLVALDREALLEMISDGHEFHFTSHELAELPILFTSSGLGDALAHKPRQKLFDSFCAAGDFDRLRQDRFHRHSWPDRSEISVCMHRADAQTVSHTTVELRADRVTLGYLPAVPAARATAAHLALRLSQMVRL
jgi:hypothetical protein